MFMTVAIEAGKLPPGERLRRILRGEQLEWRDCTCRGNRYRHIIWHGPPEKLPWGKLALLCPRPRTPVLLPPGLLPPQDSPVRAYHPQAFTARVIVAAARQAMEQTDGRGLIGLLDPQGVTPWACGEWLCCCRGVRVYTLRRSRYAAMETLLREQYGLPLLWAETPAGLEDCALCAAPVPTGVIRVRRPVLCAMTATADKQLQRGIVQSLGLRHPKRIVMPVERPNLHYSVLPTVHVTDAILRALQKIPGKAVVFCRLRARTESLAERLNRAGIPAAAYHAGLNREERSRVVQAYLSGRIRVVTATSAFGMGVDIPDIRLILHDHLPTNMIDYVQQSGRAGRDGETAYALLLFSPADLLRFHTRCQQIRLQHKHRPFTQYALIQREWRPYRRVLRFCLQAPCLSQGISAAFGQKSAPCGNCSACRSGAIGKEIPNIPRMAVQELYCWILQLHRDELHRRNPHQEQATNAQLREIAETMQLPENLPGRETYFPYLRAFYTISR